MTMKTKDVDAGEMRQKHHEEADDESSFLLQVLKL